MLLILGVIVVLASVLGGYVLSHGELAALWQPFELIIICGAALGAFLISNPFKVIKQIFQAVPKMIMGSPFNRVVYMDLLSLLYDLFDKARRSGVMAIEADVDDPLNSEIFNRYPAIVRMDKLRDFITDYLRIVSTGNMAPHELEGLMDLELETRMQELEKPADAVNRVADALPGFGIVAAVLGIVITMKSLGGPPDQLGVHVAAALVGTFLGILAAYGFVGPTSHAMHHLAAQEIKAYECVKVSILATMTGLAPQLAIEFGRKALNSDVRPSFQELNDYVRSK
ncbi:MULTISPECIES: flagellar motor stator protein MotA [unclassified Hahella]|uniref:flagellar motor stator protein MotA n=1 Tax=unclassified Hahella TaxID=2624107 RepID=UPI000FDD1628|nr:MULTISPECIES: flagellar motor stator protein MotA [unclassified Hahella]AZZ90794.1 flagellar motor stator protein MotA [Hahella sp. KA22]MBU6950060.1 flagellar motor stator protein MotA [Hahella sp. HN01]MDG9671128.1 flagellar motor stator protein MotA [Hahella sp. CR1]QAY54164.1 flagellar motor stator protein MotA [Hahella sp. KA22]